MKLIESGAAANYFLGLGEADGVQLTPMKLQKMLVLSYGWHLVVAGAAMLNEYIEAWRWVCPGGRKATGVIESLRSRGAVVPAWLIIRRSLVQIQLPQLILRLGDEPRSAPHPSGWGLETPEDGRTVLRPSRPTGTLVVGEKRPERFGRPDGAGSKGPWGDYDDGSK